VDLDVELDGLQDLEARLAHAHAGILTLDRDLASKLEREAPPMVVTESVRMRARPWGAGDVWTLPAGGWVAGRDGRVHLPDDVDQLTDTVQQLLDGPA